MLPILSGNVASALPSGYNVANSCRFDDGSSSYLTRSLTGQSVTRTWSLSWWFKRSTLGTVQRMWSSDDDSAGNHDDFFQFNTNDKLTFGFYSSGYYAQFETSRVFRDVSAWYHCLFVWDTTQGTSGDRVKVYINGTRETAFGTESYPAENSSSFIGGWSSNNYPLEFGRRGLNGTQYFDGYLAEAVFIQGVALSPTDVGEFSEDSPNIWIPKDVSGLTYANNSFYLDFEDSGDLGDDESGNTNDFTEGGLAAIDQCTDTPTNNFAVPNILLQGIAMSYNENNLEIVISADAQYGTQSSIGMTSGKWYCEVKYTARTNDPHDRVMLGIVGNPAKLSTYGVSPSINSGEGYIGSSNDTTSYGYYGDGTKYHNSGSTSYGDTWTLNDIIGIYLDCDNNKLYFSKNGVVQNSGTGISITDPADTVAGAYFFGFTDTSSYGGTVQVNFGGASCYTISSAVADANGYGSFEYSPSGTFDSASKDFLALCTKNLGSDGG